MYTMIPDVHRHDVSREASEVDSEGGFAPSWVYGGHSLASGFTWSVSRDINDEISIAMKLLSKSEIIHTNYSPATRRVLMASSSWPRTTLYTSLRTI